VQDCLEKATVRFRIFDDLVQNYYYVVTPLNSTRDSLKIWSTTADGYYFVDG